jgi:hypothetical protein
MGVVMDFLNNAFIAGTGGGDGVFSQEALALARGTDGVDTAPMRGTDGVDTATMRGTDGVDTAPMRGTDGVDPATMRGTDNADQAVWEYLIATGITPNSMGEVIDFLEGTFKDGTFGGDGVFSLESLVNAPSGTGSSPAVIAQAVWDYLIAAGITPNSMGEVMDFLESAFKAGTSGADGVYSVEALQNAPTGGGGGLIPVSQIAIPISRVWTLLRASDQALISENQVTLRMGENVHLAADFRQDLPVNGRLADFTLVEIITGTAGGVVFDDPNKGIDKTKAIVKVAAITPGTYTLAVNVVYQDAFGGAIVESEVIVIVQP